MAVPGRGKFRPGMRRIMRRRRQMKAVVTKEEVVYGRVRDKGQHIAKQTGKTVGP